MSTTYRITKPRDMDDLTNQLNRILGQIASDHDNVATVTRTNASGIKAVNSQLSKLPATIQAQVQKIVTNNNGES